MKGRGGGIEIQKCRDTVKLRAIQRYRETESYNRDTVKHRDKEAEKPRNKRQIYRETEK